MRINWKSEIKETAEALVIAVILALIIRAFVVQAFKIPSGSMEETLKIGDHILVLKFLYKFTEPKRGDIIVFKYPVDPKVDYIKRVIGVPGDKVEIREKVVYINGERYDEPYVEHVDPRTFTRRSLIAAEIFSNEMVRRDNYGPVIVPEDHYFVMGDNRDKSYDSRFWGFVPKKNIKGKAFFRYWPPTRIGIIR